MPSMRDYGVGALEGMGDEIEQHISEAVNEQEDLISRIVELEKEIEHLIEKQLCNICKKTNQLIR